MGAGHASDSAVQRRVEEHIFRLAAEKLHFELKHRVWTEARTTLPNGARTESTSTAARPTSKACSCLALPNNSFKPSQG